MSVRAKTETTENNHVRVPPCPRDRDEFNGWKNQMLTIFENHILRDVVTKPSDVIEHKVKLSDAAYEEWAKNFRDRKTKADALTKPAERLASADVKYVNEVERNKKASSLIMSALSGNQFDLVNNVFTLNAHELWTTINKAYDIVKTNETQSMLLKQLIASKKERNEGISEYFARINTVCSKLKSLNHEVRDNEWMLYMLEGLKNDSRYLDELEWIEKLGEQKEWVRNELEDHLKRAESKIEARKNKSGNNSDDIKPKLEVVAASVGDEDNQENKHSYYKKGRGGYRGRGGNRGRGSYRGRGRGRGGYNSNRGGHKNKHTNKEEKHKNKNKKNDDDDDEEDNSNKKRKFGEMKCYNCGEGNHTAKHCLAQVKRIKYRAYTAIVQQSDSDDCAYSAIDAHMNMDEIDFSQVWILDSGATSHHTGNRNLLV